MQTCITEGARKAIQKLFQFYACIFFLIATDYIIGNYTLYKNRFISFSFFFKILFIYSWQTQRMRGRNTDRHRHQAPCREPDVRLNPGTLGSCPGAKGRHSTAEPPRCLWISFSQICFYFFLNHQALFIWCLCFECLTVISFKILQLKV